MKSWIAALMVFLMAMAWGGAGYALDAEQTKPAEPVVTRYELAYKTQAVLNISSSGLATCTGKIIASESTSRVNLTLKLHKKSGSEWKLVKSWNTLNNPGQASLIKTQSVDPGTYKVTMTGTIKASSGQTERVTKWSPEKIFR